MFVIGEEAGRRAWWVRLRTRRRLRRAVGLDAGGDRGMSTAEYAVGTVAAVSFAVVLYKIVTGDTVTGALEGLIERSLDGPF